MPSSRALWQICRRLRAALLDKEEPRNCTYPTFVNKDKKGKTRQGDCARMCKKEKAPLVAEPSPSANTA
jgi:hypothetical protein